MPILHVKALPQKDPKKVSTVLKRTCLAIAEYYQCDPKQVWATWEEIRPGWYFEGDESFNVQPQQTHPPIAQLTCFEGLSDDRIEGVLLVAAKTLGDNLGLSDNVFITYHEAKSGRVVAGGGVVRRV